MGFTGDTLTITADKRFVRIDSLQIGDKLLSPQGKEVIIKNINSNYDKKGYVIKLKNFFHIYTNDKTKLFTTKILSAYNKETGKKKHILKKFSFNNIIDINNSYVLINKLDNNENKTIENLWLYGNSIMKGRLNKNNNKQLIINKPNSSIRNYENNVDNLKNVYHGKNKNYRNLYINMEDIESWFEVFNKGVHQRFLESDIFDLKKSNIEIFLKAFIKENTDMFISNNQFKVYTPSKIMVAQLFYLMLGFYNKIPTVELIKKTDWQVTKVKQSNKKRYFSITYHPEIKNLLKKNNYFLQEIDYINECNRNLRYFEIETESNEPFYIYNLIVRG